MPNDKASRLVGNLLREKEKNVEELIETLEDALSKDEQKHLPTLLAFSLDRRMKGTVGSQLQLEFLDGEGQTKSLELKRTQTEGEYVEAFNLPPTVIRHQVKNLPGGIGYLSFDGFFAPGVVLGDLKQAIEFARDGQGLIIDLRGNGGGMGGMAMGVGGPLVSDESDEKQYLGTLTTKDMSLKFVLTPRLNPYDGPVAILTDECSASTSEILAGGLQSIQRARIFGIRTAGMALPSVIETLPNGDRFQYAFATYVDSSGRILEGDGVTPDETVSQSREDLLAGKDVVLDAAANWIQSEAKNPSQDK